MGPPQPVAAPGAPRHHGPLHLRLPGGQGGGQETGPRQGGTLPQHLPDNWANVRKGGNSFKFYSAQMNDFVTSSSVQLRRREPGGRRRGVRGAGRLRVDQRHAARHHGTA